MEQFLQFTGPAIILLYLIISANFTAEVFGCRMQHYLKNQVNIMKKSHQYSLLMKKSLLILNGLKK